MVKNVVATVSPCFSQFSKVVPNRPKLPRHDPKMVTNGPELLLKWEMVENGSRMVTQNRSEMVTLPNTPWHNARVMAMFPSRTRTLDRQRKAEGRAWAESPIPASGTTFQSQTAMWTEVALCVEGQDLGSSAMHATPNGPTKVKHARKRNPNVLFNILSTTYLYVGCSENTNFFAQVKLE